MIGIYSIEINEKLYIGSSFDIKTRWNQHKSDLKHGRHANKHLQAAYNKYKNAKFTILEECSSSISDETLRKLENTYKQSVGYYNIQDPETHFGIKEVYQFTKDGVFIRKYKSCAEAASILNVSISNIVHAAQENEHNTKSAAGFYWSYVDKLTERTDNRTKIVYQYDISGKYISEFKSIEDLRMKLFPNDSYSKIAQSINDCHNYVIASYNGFRYSFDKVEQLDNSKLLNINRNYPVIQVKDKQIIKIWNTAATAAKTYNVQSCAITQACKNRTKVKGFNWLRLGTKSSELLEHPEDIEAKSELETINVNA